MIYKIAELLRDQISSLNFVEIAAGLAKPHIVRNNITPQDAEVGEVLDKIIPMAYNDLGLVCEEGDLYALVPNTTKKSITWWEDNGIQLVSEDTYYYHSRALLTLVGWWNLPLINTFLREPSSLVANLIAAVPTSLTNVDHLSQIRVAFDGEQISGAEILSKYTLNDPENQYSTFPYAVTAIDFSIDFAFGKNCVDSVVIIPSDCPPKMSDIELCSEYQAVYASYTTKPDDITAAIWNIFVETIVASGEWTKLDILYVYAAHTNGGGEALVNWKIPGTFDATAVNAPAFVANQGLTGGTDEYTNCNWNPFADGVNYTLNDTSAGTYIRNNIDNGNQKEFGAEEGGVGELLLISRLGNLAFSRVNSTGIDSDTNNDSRGMFISTRDAANSTDVYKNKVKIINVARVSSAVPNLDMYTLASNDDGVAVNFSEKQLSLFFAGSEFTQTNVNNFTDAFEVAMDALGTGVIP